MALTTCPDCQKQISDQAPACPHCGRPMHAVQMSSRAQNTSPSENVQTIEATGKKYKGLQLVGALFICLSVVSCVYHANAPTSTGAAATSAVSFFSGLLLIFFGRFGAWWHHK